MIIDGRVVRSLSAASGISATSSSGRAAVRFRMPRLC